MRPTASMIFGLSSAIWFDRYGRQFETSAGFGSRLPGGRHLRMLAMNTVSRGRPMASSIALSNWPARPTNGSPCRSSSAPGASPITSHSARVLPTPKTVCVRVLHSSAQAVQPATRSRSTPQSPWAEAVSRSRMMASARELARRRCVGTCSGCGRRYFGNRSNFRRRVPGNPAIDTERVEIRIAQRSHGRSSGNTRARTPQLAH